MIKQSLDDLDQQRIKFDFAAYGKRQVIQNGQDVFAIH